MLCYTISCHHMKPRQSGTSAACLSRERVSYQKKRVSGQFLSLRYVPHMYVRVHTYFVTCTLLHQTWHTPKDFGTARYLPTLAKWRAVLPMQKTIDAHSMSTAGKCDHFTLTTADTSAANIAFCIMSSPIGPPRMKNRNRKRWLVLRSECVVLYISVKNEHLLVVIF